MQDSTYNSGQPTEKEMAQDLYEFGDQVTGPALDEELPGDERRKYSKNAVFQLWGKDHYFIGPPRIVKMLFTSRVFPGEPPENIAIVSDNTI